VFLEVNTIISASKSKGRIPFDRPTLNIRIILKWMLKV
jgi:hypothetical protein